MLTSRDDRSLRRVAELLGAIAALTTTAAATARGGVATGGPRAAMATAIASVALAQQLQEQRPPRYVVTNLIEAVVSYDVSRAQLRPGQSLDVTIDLIAPPQTAVLYLSMAGSCLNLGTASSTMTLNISGTLGTRALTFTSGTAISDIAASINSWTASTGVHALAGPTGIRLHGTEYNAGSFVRVRALHDGSIEGPMVGVYSMQPDDPGQVDPASRVPYLVGAQDLGGDMVAGINGHSAHVDGLCVRVDVPELKVAVCLDPWNTALGFPGNLTVFRITRSH